MREVYESARLPKTPLSEFMQVHDLKTYLLIDFFSICFVGISLYITLFFKTKFRCTSHVSDVSAFLNSTCANIQINAER